MSLLDQIRNFSILGDWNIKVDLEGKFALRSQCGVNQETKEAMIFMYSDEDPFPDYYLMRMTLQIAMAAVVSDPTIERQKLLVGDIADTLWTWMGYAISEHRSRLEVLKN